MFTAAMLKSDSEEGEMLVRVFFVREIQANCKWKQRLSVSTCKWQCM